MSVDMGDTLALRCRLLAINICPRIFLGVPPVGSERNAGRTERNGEERGGTGRNGVFV